MKPPKKGKKIKFFSKTLLAIVVFMPLGSSLANTQAVNEGSFYKQHGDKLALIESVETVNRLKKEVIKLGNLNQFNPEVIENQKIDQDKMLLLAGTCHCSAGGYTPPINYGE